MPGIFRRRAAHYCALVSVWALLCLPHLGGPSLWDIDEGNNAGAGLEMKESGNWIVPTFNYQLREDKPALLYWLQVAAYTALGVNELAARLPSALAALLTVLVTYELGRRMFGKGTGLLAGLVLASSPLFLGAAHFANPDALLNAFTALTLALFWYDYAHGLGPWFFLTGVSTGLAVLAKGPVGLVLPAAVACVFLLWRRQPRRLLDVRLVPALVAFAVVAAPWYVWVSVETKWQWLAGFWKKHHQDRVFSVLEGHGGPFLYYVLVLVAGLAPWSVFLGLAGRQAWKAMRQPAGGGGESPEKEASGGSRPPLAGSRPAVQFLLCWVAVYFVFFTLVRTKLPNYVLPLYPAAAVLVAWSIECWWRGLVQVPSWVVWGGLAGLALMGLGAAVGLLIAGGRVDVALLRGRCLPGLERWAGVGGVLVLGAALAGWCLWRGRRGWAVAAVAASSLLFTGALAAWGVAVVDRYKAPRALVRALPADQTRREVRVGSHRYFQPSLVFYCRREVQRLDEEPQALEFLAGPLPSYLFVPARVWHQLRHKVHGPHRVLASHYDLYDGCDVVVVTNR